MANVRVAPHQRDAPTPSPIPPYLRPTASRHQSTDSVSSNLSFSSRRPHPQHREFVATTIGVSGVVGGEGGGDDGLAERLLFDEAEHEGEGGDDDLGDGFNDDWDNLRDGSISRRPAWRRPSPKWVYPFIVGATLAMGMGVAPRSELYVNLACLAHPPQAPSSTATSQVLRDEKIHVVLPHMSSGIWTGDEAVSINSTLPIATPDLTPADQWFLRLQHEIYEYKLHHLAHPSVPSTSATTVLPSGPLPRPTAPGGNTPIATPAEGGPDESTEPQTGTKSPFREIDPHLCKKDAKVQAAAARLTMMITVTSGLLAALTSGYWGATSDRIGRTTVMSVVETGLLLNELCFIVVATFPYLVPGGYRALLVGPAIDGLLGGFSTLGATVHAYVSDVTADGSRATVFARLGGIMMTGFAFGPMLGSFVINATGNIMFPFYINICVHLLYIILIIFLLPESLSSDARFILTKNAALSKEAARRRDEAEREWENEAADPLLASPNGADSGWSRLSHAGHSKRRKRLVGNMTRLFRRVTSPLQPLAIFLPREKDDGGMDYNLTATGFAIFMVSMIYGILQVKTQYTFYAYGWTSAQLGPYISLVGFSRGAVLIVLVPVVMHFAKPYFAAPQPSKLQPGTSGFTTASGVSGVTSISASDTGIPDLRDEQAPTAKPGKIKRSAQLDLLTIRVSILIEMSLYLVMASDLSPTAFVITTVLITLGSASSPNANSLALSLLPNSREAGKLFGALSVLHALGATLISPLLFGTLFAYTVGWYAPTVFALASGFLFLAQVGFAFVRLPKDAGVQGKAERGRSRNVKRVKSSAPVNN